METTSGGSVPDGANTFECSKCGDAVPNEDAVAIVRSKQMWKPLCKECLSDIGTPQGYELVRDLSHLKT